MLPGAPCSLLALLLVPFQGSWFVLLPHFVEIELNAVGY